MSRSAMDELMDELGEEFVESQRSPVECRPSIGKSGFVPSSVTAPTCKGFHGVPGASSEASIVPRVACRSLPPLEYVGESKTDYVAAHATPEEMSWVEPPARMSIEELYHYLKGGRGSGG